MEFQIKEYTEISESLLDSLDEINKAIFSDFTTPFSKEKLAKTAQNVAGLHIVMAFEGDKVAGFKAGYRSSGMRFYWLGGVRKDYRGHGLAKKLMTIQHQFAKNEGYSVVETRTKNLFQNMIITNLKSGFKIVGTTMSIGDTEPVLILEKNIE